MSIFEENEPSIITNVEGSRIIPTVVAFVDTGEILIGQKAERQAVLNPERTVFPLKRLIDLKSDNLHFQEFKNFNPNETTISDKGDVWIKINDEEYSPQHLIAIFFSKIKENVSTYLGQDIVRAVIGVPASFNEFQRQAIRDAGRMAGLEVERIIDESSLAAIAHSINYEGKDKIIAIYDFGGGCFSISILEVGDGVFEVKSTNGNNYLGGDYFDFRIMEDLIAEFDAKKDNITLQRLKDAIKRARQELSVIKNTSVELPNIILNSSGIKNIDITLSREKLDLLVRSFVEQSIKVCQKAIIDFKKYIGKDDHGNPIYEKGSVDDIDEVILMGGLSRMPMVKRMVMEFFKKKPCLSLDLEESVAIGAAIIGGVLTGDCKSALLLDVTPCSLGLEFPKGMLKCFIPKGTTIPTKKTEVFSGNTKKQISDKIRIFQGEGKKHGQNILLKEIDINGIIDSYIKEYELEISFDVDSNNVLHVNVENLKTGNKQSTTVVARRGLTKGDFQRLNKVGSRYD